MCQEKRSKGQETSAAAGAAGSMDDVTDTIPMDENGVDSAPRETDEENFQEFGEEENEKEDDPEVLLVVGHELRGGDMEDSQPALAKDKTQAPKSVTPAQPDETPAMVSEEEGPEACKGTHKDCMLHAL